MRRRDLLAAAPAVALAVHAQAAQLVVVELFTSQSCDSCPPADAFLRELRDRPDVLVLSWHVTYWNNLGWRDRFSLAEATERQRRYAGTLRGGRYGNGQVYTPQAVVQGVRDAVGSDRPAVLAAMREAARAEAMALRLSRDGDALLAEVPAGSGRGTLRLVGFDREHVTQVASGENRGRTLAHANVVRGVAQLGGWEGQALRLHSPAPTGEHAALLLQGVDGRIMGAARV
jgi:hypothetical protein